MARWYRAASVAAAMAATAAPAGAVTRVPYRWIPILEYHAVGGPAEFTPGPRYDVHGLNIAPATFRLQLAEMYRAGWRPVNLRDAVAGGVALRRDRRPVVLTFDDARPSQYRLLANRRIDPDCAVGILEAFHRRHPDWRLRGTFFLLPESQWNGVPFDQDGLEAAKLRHLFRDGFELANHGTSHRSMAAQNVSVLRFELANCQRYVRRLVPRATMDTMALPYGELPVHRERVADLRSGEWQGVRYSNRCVALASGGPMPWPSTPGFDANAVPRILPEPGAVERWIAALPAWDRPARRRRRR